MGVNTAGRLRADIYCLSSAGFNRAVAVYISRDMPLNAEHKKAASQLHDLEAMVRGTML